MIRAILVLVVGAILTGFYATLALIGARRPDGVCACDRVTRRWCRLVLRIAGVRVRLEGLERVEWSEPLVVIANHQSWFDVFVLAGFLPAHVRFVAKEELGRIPIFGPAWRACGHISLDRSDRKRALESLDHAARKVREDKLALVLFPEGTRSPDGRLWAFKKGAFVLAIKTEVPIVPLGIAGSRTVMPKGSFRVRPGEIRIRVGEPIRVEGMRLEDRDRLLGLSRAAVAELIEDADGMVGTAGPADGARTDDGEEGRE